MRKLIVLMHASLDGFVAGPNGEMDWIKINDKMFDEVGKLTDNADAVIYGRKTFDMMAAYWPTAGLQPGASKHDIEHTNWTNKVQKIVFSRTRTYSDWKGTTFISDNMKEEVLKLKNQPGKDILLIGSPSIIHQMLKLDLIDEFWININPIILGEGVPLFKDAIRTSLKLTESIIFDDGVIGTRYVRL